MRGEETEESFIVQEYILEKILEDAYCTLSAAELRAVWT